MYKIRQERGNVFAAGWPAFLTRVLPNAQVSRTCGLKAKVHQAMPGSHSLHKMNGLWTRSLNEVNRVIWPKTCAN